MQDETPDYNETNINAIQEVLYVYLPQFADTLELICKMLASLDERLDSVTEILEEPKPSGVKL